MRPFRSVLEKIAFILRFMNNEIFLMFVGFVRVLRPLGLPRILYIPAFSVSIVHKFVVEAFWRGSPADSFASRVLSRECGSILH